MNPEHCTVQARYLTGAKLWRQVDCDCCAKFCGILDSSVSCDGSNYICEIKYGACRIVSTIPHFPEPSSSLDGLYAIIYVLLILIWILSLLVLRQVALEDERKYLTRMFLLRKAKEERDQKAERWAIGLGFVLGVLSIGPFYLAVKVGRLQAQHEFRRREDRQRKETSLGQYLNWSWLWAEIKAADLKEQLNEEQSSSMVWSMTSSPAKPFRGRLLPKGRSVSPNPSSSPRHALSYDQVDIESPSRTPHYTLRMDSDEFTEQPVTSEKSFWDKLVSTADLVKVKTVTSFDSLRTQVKTTWENLPKRTSRMVANEEGENSPQRLIIPSAGNPQKFSVRRFIPITPPSRPSFRQEEQQQNNQISPARDYSSTGLSRSTGVVVSTLNFDID